MNLVIYEGGDWARLIQTGVIAFLKYKPARFLTRLVYRHVGVFGRNWKEVEENILWECVIWELRRIKYVI